MRAVDLIDLETRMGAYADTKGAIVGGGAIYVQQTTPSSPNDGDLWVTWT